MYTLMELSVDDISASISSSSLQFTSLLALLLLLSYILLLLLTLLLLSLSELASPNPSLLSPLDCPVPGHLVNSHRCSDSNFQSTHGSSSHQQLLSKLFESSLSRTSITHGFVRVHRIALFNQQVVFWIWLCLRVVLVVE